MGTITKTLLLILALQVGWLAFALEPLSRAVPNWRQSRLSIPPKGANATQIRPMNSTVPFPGSQALLADEFYRPPAGFENAKLGSILKIRKVPYPLRFVRGYEMKARSAWQILYRTQNSVKEPSATIVTLLVPSKSKPKNLFVMSYFTNAAYRLCNPSFALQSMDPDDNQIIHFQSILVVWALSQGYYVSVADDGGTGPSNPSGPQMGYATLDSIRAVLESRNVTGIDNNPIITLHGYSGGAIASGWATELQPQYAPELRIAGAAIGGLVYNTTALIRKLNKSWYISFSPPTLINLSRDYKDLGEWLDANLVEKYKADFYKPATQCQMSNEEQFPRANLDKYFKKGYESVYNDPVPARVIKDMGDMGLRSTPTIPWFLFTNIGDNMVEEPGLTKLVNKHCSNGANILYERNLSPVDHGMAVLYRYAGAMKWLREVHSGRAVEQGCKAKFVMVNDLLKLPADELMIFVEAMLESFLAAIGVPI